jgi:excisionase family DNA binding protein
MSHAPPEPLMTPAEVAAIFKVDAKTVTRWAKAGKLTAIRTVGGHRRYKEAEVRALLNPAPETPRDPLAAPVHTLWPVAVTGPRKAVRDRVHAAGIATVGELAGCGAGDLRDLGLRSDQVDEVRLVLARKGFTLHGEILGGVA